MRARTSRLFSKITVQGARLSEDIASSCSARIGEDFPRRRFRDAQVKRTTGLCQPPNRYAKPESPVHGIQEQEWSLLTGIRPPHRAPVRSARTSAFLDPLAGNHLFRTRRLERSPTHLERPTPDISAWPRISGQVEGLLELDPSRPWGTIGLSPLPYCQQQQTCRRRQANRGRNHVPWPLLPACGD